MDQVTSILEHHKAEFARISGELPGGAKVSQQRQTHLANFLAAGFPTVKQEDWKYTDLKKMAAKTFEVSLKAEALSAEALEAKLPADFQAYRAVVVDGFFNAELSKLDGLPKGVEVGSFAKYLNDDAQASILHPQVSHQNTGLSEMNAAFVTDGVYVNVADGVTLDQPLHVIVVSTGTQPLAMSHIRNRFVLGKNSALELVDHQIGLGEETYFTNSVTEILTQANAHLKRYRLQEESLNGYHIAAVFAEQKRDSSFDDFGFDLGGLLVRTDTHAYLGEDNTQTHYHGVYMPTGKQHMDNHTVKNHDAEHGQSSETFKGIVNDRGRGVFNGKVIVHKYAQKTDSDQQTDALQLSKRGQIDAKPELEIYADDVKCAHGSTIGQLDKTALFYLKSRGLDDQQAQALLIYGFASSLVMQVPYEPVQKHIENAVMAKLGDVAEAA